LKRESGIMLAAKRIAFDASQESEASCFRIYSFAYLYVCYLCYLSWEYCNLASSKNVLVNMSSILRAAPRFAAFARTPTLIQKRTILTLKEHKYTAHATSSGAGRNGNVISNDGTAKPLDLKLAMPTALGGDGKGVNPEQLFASGYAGCFLGALQAVARSQGKSDAVKDAKINLSVHIGTPTDKPGFGIAVDIAVQGVSDKELIQAAHDACPYSRALKYGATVNVSP